MSTAHTITKSIAMFVAVALLLNAMVPTLAQAAKHLQGDQVNANALVRDAYIAVTYRDSNDRERSARGWIDAIGETSFTLRSGGLKSKTTIAYANILSIIMSDESTLTAKQMNEVNRFIRNRKTREIDMGRAIQRINEQIAMVMTRGQVDLSEIKKGWYAHAIYTSKGTKETATGWIVSKDANSIAIKKQNWERWKIAYSDIDTLVVAKRKRDIDRWKNARQTGQLFYTHNAKVRFKAPSLTKKRIVGEVVKMTQDTLLLREGRTFLQVPLSSISNFEVSFGQRRNTVKGMAIGLGVGLFVSIALFRHANHLDNSDRESDKAQALIASLLAVSLGPSIVVLSTLIGVAIKSEKWVAVPPQRLNLSIAPTPEKGLRAALTVNF